MGTENVKLGVCNVFYDGEDLGLTKGGVEVEVSTETHEVMVDQFGNTPVDELINGRTVTANVPMVETTIDNLMRIMPGSVLMTDGAFATGTVTFSGAPSDGDSVALFGSTFYFRTTPVTSYDMPIPADQDEAADTLVDYINSVVMPVSAKVTASGEVTITANSRGTEWNLAIDVTGTNLTATDMSSGADVTSARVDVITGINISLLSIAKKLVLRPVGTYGGDDFIIYKAAAPGALNFTYNVDQERIFTANFKGYVDAQQGGALFGVGDEAAT